MKIALITKQIILLFNKNNEFQWKFGDLTKGVLYVFGSHILCNGENILYIDKGRKSNVYILWLEFIVANNSILEPKSCQHNSNELLDFQFGAFN